MLNSHLKGACIALTVLSAAFITGCEQGNVTEQVVPAGNFQKVAQGIVVNPAQGQAKVVRLQVMADDIIRVTALPHSDFSSVADSLMVVAEPDATFSTQTKGSTVVLSTDALTAEVSLLNGQVVFKNARGEVLLDTVNSGEFGPVTQDPVAPDDDSYAIRQQWNQNSDEGFFGLGQHQNGQINYAGENVELSTHNLQISIP